MDKELLFLKELQDSIQKDYELLMMETLKIKNQIEFLQEEIKKREEKLIYWRGQFDLLDQLIKRHASDCPDQS